MSFAGKMWAHSRVLWRPETNLSYLTTTEVLDLDIRFMHLNWHLAEHWRHSGVNHHPQDFLSHQGNQPKVFWVDQFWRHILGGKNRELLSLRVNGSKEKNGHRWNIVIFYSEILTGKVVLWCFFSSDFREKIHMFCIQIVNFFKNGFGFFKKKL